MASSTLPKHADDALTESLLNPDVDEQLILEEDWPQEVQVGEKQPPQYRDVLFAVLFILQLLVVIGFAIFWGFPALRYGPPKENNTEDVEFSGILFISLLSGLASFVISAVALSVMTRYAHLLVQFSVLFSIFSSLMMVIVFGFQDKDGAAFVAFLFFCLSSFWAWAVWKRIPFATSNLVCALTAIRANLGVVLVAYVMVIAAVVWTMIWMTSFIGVYAQSVECNSQGVCYGKIGSWTIVLYLLSFYWTQQVFKNLIHVTVAGVVGTFWFEPSEASSMFSKAIMDSAIRSLTYSLGSVCLGSLLTAAIQVCHTFVKNARTHGDDGIVMCILDCLLGCIERIVEYFNKFSYVYVGLYGYSYFEASRKVVSLFAQRGWSVIINDDLVTNALVLMSFIIACLTGCVGLALASAHKSWVAEFSEKQSMSIPFFSAFLIGIIIASILMSVVSSGVDTVLVCFAEAPTELRQNHPRLSDQMVRAWRLVYPGEFSYTILASDSDADGVYTAPPSQSQPVPLVASTSTTAAENQRDSY
jgi:hypothetical protein